MTTAERPLDDILQRAEQRRNHQHALRYAAALASVGIALAITLPLETWDLRITLFAFYAAVVFSAWMGTGPGVLSVVLSVLAVQYFFTPPEWGFEVKPQDVPFTGAFMICAVMSLAWASQRQRTERVLKEARASLEETVRQRTLELVNANEALKVEMAERQAAELELRDTEAKLARTLRLATVAEMTASIAHEINQPLAAIVANASACVRSLAREPPVLPVATEAAGCIMKDGIRAGEVITRIRALLGKHDPVCERFDLNALIRETLDLSRGPIERHHILVRTTLATGLPMLEGDRIQLQQMLVNLITNGIEAMADVTGRPRELTIRTAGFDNDKIEITVDDAGCGLDPAHLHEVFDSFYTTKPEGIGVGLSISKSIVETHEGELSATPRQPYGARFTVRLPIRSAH